MLQDLLAEENVRSIITLGRTAPELIGTNENSRKLQHCQADLSKPASLTGLPDNIDAIIHLAQSRRYRNFPEGADDMFAINTAATHRLAHHALTCGAKSFVYASTGSVYLPQSHTVGESDDTSTSNFYAASKLAAEALLTPYSEHLNVCIGRLFYVYGPGQKDMITNILANRIHNGNPVTLQGKDGISLSPMASRDAARCLKLAAMDGWQGVFNIGSPNAITIREFATAIGQTMGKDPAFESDGEAPEKKLLPNVNKLKLQLGNMDEFLHIKEGLKLMFPAAERT